MRHIPTRAHYWVAVFCASAALAIGMPAASQTADDTRVFEALWSNFMAHCPAAVEDFDSYVETVRQTAPEGSFGMEQTQDGEVLSFYRAVGGSEFSDLYDRFEAGGLIRQSCSSHFAGSALQNSETAEKGFVAFVADKIGPGKLFGGQIDELYSEYASGSNQLSSNSYNAQFFIEGVFDAPSLVVEAQIVPGYASLGLHTHGPSGTE